MGYCTKTRNQIEVHCKSGALNIQARKSPTPPESPLAIPYQALDEDKIWQSLPSGRCGVLNTGFENRQYLYPIHPHQNPA